MPKLSKTFLYALLAALAVAAPVVLYAQTPPGLFETAYYAGLPVGQTDPVASVGRIVNIFLGFLGALAVALMIVAGFKWMTSGGNETQISEAKALLRNALIGLVIVFGAFIVTLFTVNALRQSTGQYFGGTTCTTPPPASQCAPGTAMVCENGSWVCSPT